MSPQLARLQVIHESFPRVSGDEPHSAASSLDPSVFSPRERG